MGDRYKDGEIFKDYSSDPFPLALLRHKVVYDHHSKP